MLPSVPAPDPSLTLRAYAATWLPRHQRRLKPQSRYVYERALAAYVLPHLGDHVLADLRRRDVIAAADALEADHLSVGTIRQALAVLSSLLTDAVERELIVANPARGLLRRFPKQPHRKVVLDATQLELVLTAAPRVHRRLGPLLIACGEGGLRLGEARALGPHDVDLVTQQIRVARTAPRSPKFGEPGTPKSGRSRVVHMTRFLTATLAPIVEERQGCRYLFPGFYDEDRPISESAVRGALAEACDVAQVARATVHSLRHSFASLALAKKRLSPAYVQTQLGHATFAMTVDLYGSHFPHDRPPEYDRD